MSRPLVAFRAAVNDMLERGIAPTPGNMAKITKYRKWVKVKDRTFKTGHLAKAREEELLSAGWRRVTYQPESRNFAWQPVKRTRVKGLKSLFRIGDVCIPFSTALINEMGAVLPDYVEVVAYSPEGKAIISVAGRKEQLTADDSELILAVPTPKFPLK